MDKHDLFGLYEGSLDQRLECLHSALSDLENLNIPEKYINRIKDRILELELRRGSSRSAGKISTLPLATNLSLRRTAEKG